MERDLLLPYPLPVTRRAGEFRDRCKHESISSVEFLLKLQWEMFPNHIPKNTRLLGPNQVAGLLDPLITGSGPQGIMCRKNLHITLVYDGYEWRASVKNITNTDPLRPTKSIIFENSLKYFENKPCQEF